MLQRKIPRAATKTRRSQKNKKPKSARNAAPPKSPSPSAHRWPLTRWGFGPCRAGVGRTELRGGGAHLEWSPRTSRVRVSSSRPHQGNRQCAGSCRGAGPPRPPSSTGKFTTVFCRFARQPYSGTPRTRVLQQGGHVSHRAEGTPPAGLGGTGQRHLTAQRGRRGTEGWDHGHARKARHSPALASRLLGKQVPTIRGQGGQASKGRGRQQGRGARKPQGPVLKDEGTPG